MHNVKFLKTLGSKALTATLAGAMALTPTVTTFAAELEQDTVTETTTDTEDNNTNITDDTTDMDAKDAETSSESDSSTTSVTKKPQKEDYYVLEKDKYDEAVEDYKSQNPEPTEEAYTEFDENGYNQAVKEHESTKPNELDYLTEEENATRLKDIEAWKSAAPTKERFTNKKKYEEDVERHTNSEPKDDENFSNQYNPDYVKAITEHNRQKVAEEGRLMQENTVYHEEEYNKAMAAYDTALEQWNENAVEEGQDGYDEWLASKPVEPIQSDYTELNKEAVNKALNKWSLENQAPSYEDYVATNKDGETFEEVHAKWVEKTPNLDDYFNESAYEQAVWAHSTSEPKKIEPYILDKERREQYLSAMSGWNDTAPSETDYKTEDKEAWQAAYDKWVKGLPSKEEYTTFDEDSYNKDMELYREYLISIGKHNSSSSGNNESSSTSSITGTTTTKSVVALNTIDTVKAGTKLDASTLKLGDTGYTVASYMDALFSIKNVKDGSIPVGYAFTGLLEKSTVSQEFIEALSSIQALDTVYLDTKTAESKATDQFGNVIYNYGKIGAMTSDSVVMMMGVTKTGDIEMTQAYFDVSTGNAISIFRKDVVVMTPIAIIPLEDSSFVTMNPISE